jgi:uncharacterized peroxidase-related enzyme
LFVASAAQNWRRLSLTAEDEALCAYAEKLTRTPSQMSEADVAVLRQLGFDDRAIHDATQVIAYFNYINRIAEPLGVEMEEFVREWERPLL